MANKAVERYHGDPDYRFLHDRVSDLMAECLKHDIQEFNQHQQQRREQEHNQKKKKMKTLELNITGVANCYRFHARRIRIFEPNVPARAAAEGGFGALETSLGSSEPIANKWGYDQRLVYSREPDTSVSVVHKYMVALRTAITAAESKSESVSESMIEASAVLPHRIVPYAVEYNGLYERAAELQWKRKMDDVYKKQGRLNNCLAVCDAGASMSVALGLFVSQLSQGPWEGKVVNYSQKPSAAFGTR
ncbi:uncharacterized protein Pyn_14586 [Prunus yedoensis var. nudiflora]|uniref:DUF2828 domain-containing protein n=1 Tax=Prunus yedoensis var. nudiflora TaxID=2094558 RepID=A0A314Y8G2_PRUYE|nr:uncharacterized protein Pyn_14586 [Prunus yedoensis var. nudiflora]